MAVFRKLAIAQAVSAVAVGGASAALAEESAGPSLSLTAYDYDVETDGIGNAKYPAVDLENTHKAFSAELQWPLSGGWDVRVGVTQLEASNKTELTEQDNPGPAKYQTTSIASRMSVGYDFLDFEAGHTMQLGSQDVRVFGGLRYAEIDQDSDVGYADRYENTAIPSTNTFTARKRADHDLSALGLRFGAESDFTISEDCGLSVSGLLAGVALYGERDSSYYNQYPFLGLPVEERSEESWWYGLEAELALNWQVMPKAATSPTVSLGYSFSRMENILETRFSTDDVIQHRESDLTLEGPFLRLGWQF
ncbi:MAG: hypothetical protein EP312_00735 [Gammaproteobacteria bacterium]|nr:MAG: hypothetical protein EP312_00735 [Gammaproteobacteria bacterium]